MNTPGKDKKVSLYKALSKRGVLSRTLATQAIKEGLVTVNGKQTLDPFLRVDLKTAHIELNQTAATEAEPFTLLLNKPKGVVTTRADEKGRPTVYDCIGSSHPWLIAVGRLDQASSGLLLMTNDTTFSAWVTEPKNNVPKEYAVSVRGRWTDALSSTLTQKGLVIEGELLKATSLIARKVSNKESHLLVTLTEGKNREIRRMLEAVKHPVTALHRIRFGGLSLPRELQPGKWVELKPAELRAAFPNAPLR